jgi:hypothetical protein
LLFGANSAGKSSMLHALQHVREILERNNANADRTLQGGDAVDLGGFPLDACTLRVRTCSTSSWLNPLTQSVQLTQ